MIDKKQKKFIKILTVLIIIIVTVSYIGYEYGTEPKNIKTVNANNLPKIMELDKYVMGKFSYNITQHGTKSEFLIIAHIPNREYCPKVQIFLTIATYKIEQKLIAPITNSSIFINNINLYINNNKTSYISSINTYNYSIQQAIGFDLPRYGNNSINLSFSITPIYEIYFLHYKDKPKQVDFIFNLTGVKISSKGD